MGLRRDASETRPAYSLVLFNTSAGEREPGSSQCQVFPR
jgi:hypothetical protein